ncbi:phage tail protein [Pseudomonas sp. LH21]|uniref:phage tail protein n=1 Tax=Pseudomonas sp. LH21 TaxID=3114884 RepID=UPI002F9207A4
MVDQNSQFYAILTNVGAAKQANADALGIPWKITQMGVGDANGTDPTPNATQTSLISEWRRAPLNLLKVDDKNSAIIIAEQVIPADVGGKWIREIALYDADGDMVAVANCAPTYKPLLSQGSGRTQVVRMNLIVSSSSNVQLKIDPAVVLATREYVDAAILSVLPKNKVAGSYTKVTIDERGIVQQGANPTTLSGYGILDAYTQTQTDAKLALKMSKGAGGLLGDAPVVAGALTDLTDTQFVSVTNGTTDKPAAIGYGAGFYIKYPGDRYSFQMLAGMIDEWYGVRRVAANGAGTWRELWHDGNFTPALKANLAGAAFTGPVRVPDVVAGNSSDLAANTKFVMEAVAKLVASSPAALDTLRELAAALGDDPNFAATMANALAGKAAKSTTLAGYGITDAFPKSETFSRTDIQYLITQAVGALLPKRGFTANDFIRIPDVPGGLIIQFGATLVGPDAAVDVTLPLAFNVGLGALAGVAASAATIQGNTTAYATLLSNQLLRVTQDINTTSGGVNQTINWWAWGY